MTNNNEEIKLDENVQNNPFKEGEMECLKKKWK